MYGFPTTTLTNFLSGYAFPFIPQGGRNVEVFFLIHSAGVQIFQKKNIMVSSSVN